MKKERKPADKATIKFIILISIIVIALFLSIYLHSIGFSISGLEEKLVSYKNLAPYVYVLLYVFASLIPVPYMAFTFLGALIFQPVDAFIFSLAGNIIFITITFFLARWLGRDYIERWERANNKIKKLDINLEKNAFRDTLLLRFFFIIPSEVVNLVAGLSKMKFADFFYASSFGLIPGLIISVLMIRGIVTDNISFIFIAIISGVILHIIPLIYIIKLRILVKKTLKKCVDCVINLNKYKHKKASWK